MQRNVRKKKVSSKYEGMTREEKRELVISEGKDSLYIACPLCGFNRPVGKYDTGAVKFSNMDLDVFHFLVTRCGGGLGSGFFKVPERSHILQEVKQMPEYNYLIEDMKLQLKKILEVLG